MTDRLTWLVRDSSGNPWSGATPSCTIYDRAGTVRSTPAPTNLGGGEFAVFPTEGDTAVGVFALIDNGASAQTRYVIGVSSDGPFDAFLLTDEVTGALWAGAAPTLGLYASNAGVDITPHPSLPRPLAYVATLAPVGTEDVNYRVDAPSGAAIDHDQGAFIQENPTSPVFTGSWAQVEQALRLWIRTATGFDEGHVIYDDQDGARPTKPYAAIHIGDVVPIGIVDPVETVYNSGQPNGSEISMRATGMREFHASISCFTDQTRGDGAARAFLARAQTALSLPSVRDALSLAAVSPFDVGPVQNVSAVLGTKFESRAVLDIGFYTLQSFTEYTGYIGSVGIKGDIDGGRQGDDGADEDLDFVAPLP